MISNNIAWNDMPDKSGGKQWLNSIVTNGIDITKKEVNDDSTLGGRFAGSVWKTMNGYLPGLGAAVEMPSHLRMSTGIVSATLNNQIRVYPNPTKGMLIIENGDAGSSVARKLMENVKLYDSMGRILNNSQFSIINSQLLIDISNQAKGIYFLNVGDQTVKIIKE
jgi:hypothetical protein